MSPAPRAWVLNLDADRELALGPDHPRSTALRAQLHAHAAPVAATLPAGDVWVDGPGDPRGLEGRCWCPTPSARARLTEVAARLSAHDPPFEVLRRVNGRSFSHRLCPLEGELVLHDPDAARRTLERGHWMVHREHTFAGRGHRFVHGPPTAEDLGWIDKGLTLGPLFAAPRLALELEVALHGHVRPGGGVDRGVVTAQEVDRGQWRRSVRAEGALRADEARALERAFEAVAAALIDAGYTGPFGLDAFRHAGGFHPLSELNARYSMGYPVGMGGW